MSDPRMSVKQMVNGMPNATQIPDCLLRKIKSMINIRTKPIMPFTLIIESRFLKSILSSSRRINSTGELSVNKLGMNISKGGSVESSSITANPGDTVEFVVYVKSTSNTALTNVIVRDVLPNYMTYINNSTSVNNIVVADGIAGAGINVGTINPGDEALLYQKKIDLSADRQV